jgi:hypothetical protein
MNIIGQIVSEASATVVRAPQNLWLDEADKVEAKENKEGDS